MIDPDKAREVIKQEIENLLFEKETKAKKKFWAFFRITKYIFYNIFAFIGVTVLFYHFILGQPYICAEYYSEETYITDDDLEMYTENELIECKENSYALMDLKFDCEWELEKLETSCEEYCLQKVYEPYCQALNISFKEEGLKW